jgi:hypothetical protein
MPSPAHPLAALAGRGRRPRVVLSWGLGVDSTAVLLRWLLEPSSRDFPLEDLVVVTAMTGDEWARTGRDAAEHVLPALRRHGVRLVQLARGRRNVSIDGDGVVVLDDSTSPEVLHPAGVYTLSDELAEAGTIPQSGGARLCSVHAKGDVLDPAIARLTGGHPYRHAVGFETGEASRAAKDTGYNTAARTGWYPLIDWGWHRTACLDFLREVTGITWSKSACVFCPYAVMTRAGRAEVLPRWQDEEPTAGLTALTLEHTALALNPEQGLIAGRRAVDYVRLTGHHRLLAELDAHLAATAHALYEVRRVLRPRRDDPAKLANGSRSLRRLATGERGDLQLRLADLARADDVDLEHGEDGIVRVWLRRRGPRLPTGEHFLTVAPATATDKQPVRFEQWWAALPAEQIVQPRQLRLAL